MKINHHDITVKNKLAEAFAHNMAAKASWRRNYVAVALYVLVTLVGVTT